MKKIKIILLTIIFILPVIVKADMSAPMSNYKVRVSNVNGAYLYDYDSDQKAYVKTEYKVEYDTIIEVHYEKIIDDEFYAYVCINDNKTCGYINLSNTSAEEINLDDYYHEYAVTYYVFDDTCYLYDGPSEKVYNKLNPEKKLEVGYTFTSNYYDDLWTYIPEKKAWVYTYTYSKYSDLETAGVMPKDTTNIITMEEIKIYNNPKTKDTILGTIPANTELTSEYGYSMQPYKGNYYITYNGITGFIETNYNESDNMSNFAFGVSSNTSLKVENSNGISLYKDSDLSEVIATIPYGTELSPSYSMGGSHSTYMYRVEYNNQVGWIKNNDEDFKFSYTNNVSDNSNEVDDSSNKVEEPSVIGNSNKNKLSTNKVIIICVVVVVIVSLTALVSILLVNKKKDRKNVNKDTNNNN